VVDMKVGVGVKRRFLRNVRPESLLVFVFVNCRSMWTLRSRTSRGSTIGVEAELKTVNTKGMTLDCKTRNAELEARSMTRTALAREFPTRSETKGGCGYSYRKENLDGRDSLVATIANA
jgi:hypothetical protein